MTNLTELRRLLQGKPRAQQEQILQQWAQQNPAAYRQLQSRAEQAGTVPNGGMGGLGNVAMNQGGRYLGKYLREQAPKWGAKLGFGGGSAISGSASFGGSGLGAGSAVHHGALASSGGLGSGIGSGIAAAGPYAAAALGLAGILKAFTSNRNTNKTTNAAYDRHFAAQPRFTGGFGDVSTLKQLGGFNKANFSPLTVAGSQIKGNPAYKNLQPGQVFNQFGNKFVTLPQGHALNPKPVGQHAVSVNNYNAKLVADNYYKVQEAANDRGR